ncbi:MAG TPA: hypothetical protein VG097_09810, partial [Gemmata sp.]|nr:hypothetical protein [Gemmata sp.]
MAEAGFIDDGLYVRMNGFEVEYNNTVINLLHENEAQVIDCELEESLWIADLRKRLGPDLKDILICRVQVNDESNLVIVDRAHQHQ